jgi:hypothetical protein
MAPSCRGDRKGEGEGEEPRYDRNHPKPTVPTWPDLEVVEAFG